MDTLALTLSQAFQLVALGPCLFVAVYLAVAVRKRLTVVIPILYFLSLACGFLLPLADLWTAKAHASALYGLVLWGESFSPALSFLLILQLVMARIPPAFYWLTLALPAVGGSSFVIAAMQAREICLQSNVCFTTTELHVLYGVFGAALTFLLLVAVIGRHGVAIGSEDVQRRHKYWLVIALIATNLMLLGVDLAAVAGALPLDQAAFTATMIRIAFLYLVMTSIFRVFQETLVVAAAPPLPGLPQPQKRELTAEEIKLAEAAQRLMEQEKPYRELGFNREALAQRLGVKEYHLSRVINAHYKQSCSEFLNRCRIAEAQERLRNEDTQVTVIAFETGFSSIASFNRVFKELTGMPPSEYRERHRPPTPEAREA